MAYFLARYAGRPIVYKLADRETVDYWERVANQKGTVFFTIAFLLTPTGDQPLGGVPKEGIWPTFTPTATFADWMIDGTATDAWKGAKVCEAPGGGILAVIKGETFEPDPFGDGERFDAPIASWHQKMMAIDGRITLGT